MGRKRIGFIGGGNMAEALLKGLLAGGQDPATITIGEPLTARRAVLRRRYKVAAVADNLQVVEQSDIVVLAIKPQHLGVALAGLRGVVGGRLVVSIVAGARLARLEKGLGRGARVVRVMPNTPCLVGRGMSVLCGGKGVRPVDLSRARALFAAVGSALVVEDEKLMDVVTGLSGSGPAYVYLFAEALMSAGKAAGLDDDMARVLACQTLAGAAEMLIASKESPADLRRAVSSPGGTTVAGLGVLDEAGFKAGVQAAVKAATRRSRELGRAKF